MKLELMKKDVPIMSKNDGLCMTCNNAPTCTHPRDAERPVLRCEDFYSYALPTSKNTIKNILSPKDSHGQSGTREEMSNNYKGLCINCEERASCTYEMPEGGVWHCEEYR